MLYANPPSVLTAPSRQREGCLVPRATLVPALHRGVTYRNHTASELVTSLNGNFRFAYRAEDTAAALPRKVQGAVSSALAAWIPFTSSCSTTPAWDLPRSGDSLTTMK